MKETLFIVFSLIVFVSLVFIRLKSNKEPNPDTKILIEALRNISEKQKKQNDKNKGPATADP